MYIHVILIYLHPQCLVAIAVWWSSAIVVSARSTLVTEGICKRLAHDVSAKALL